MSDSTQRDREAIRRAIEQLPDGQRRVVEMSLLGDKSIAEIAVVLGMSQAAVRVAKYRALRQLRTLIEERVDYDDEILSPTVLPVFIDPGNAPEELITELFVALAVVYRSCGGSGLQVSKDQRRSLVGELQ